MHRFRVWYGRYGNMAVVLFWGESNYRTAYCVKWQNHNQIIVNTDRVNTDFSLYPCFPPSVFTTFHAFGAHFALVRSIAY